MMRFLSKFSLLVLTALLLSACGQKSAGLQEGAVSPDKTLFENGMKFLKKSYFIKARLSFQTLINTYPESEYTPLAFYAIADSYYDEGGTENLLQAESQYKDFIIYYPNDDKADDAQLKIAAINYRLMKPYDRDPTYARKAEAELKKFLEMFPDSDLAPTAQEFLHDVEENRANSIQDVGNFYFKRGAYNASQSRYQEVLKDYPTYSHLDATLYNLAESLEKTGRIEEATVYYAQLVEGYPFSDHFDDAREKLILLEKPVPEVNKQLAAQHEANRRIESFSLLDPIRGVIHTFTGGEDPYEVAKRRAEERKLAQQQTTTSTSATQQKDKEEKKAN